MNARPLVELPLGVSDWWFALQATTQQQLRSRAHTDLSGAVLDDVRLAEDGVAERCVVQYCSAASADRDRWFLTRTAAHWVGVMDAVTVTALALAAWDRRAEARDQVSSLRHLYGALQGVGSLVEQLQDVAAWQGILHHPDDRGITLADVLDAFRWARDAPGGLREAAQLYGVESWRSGVWHRDTWWYTTEELGPAYAATLAGLPATDLIRRVLAGFAEFSTAQTTVGAQG